MPQSAFTHPAVAPPRDSTFGVVCAAMAAGVAAAVLLGWVVGNRLLVQVGPAFAPMQVNTGLCFLAMGAGIAALSVGPSLTARRSVRTASIVLSAAAVAVSLATLVQYAMNVDFGIDEFIVEAYITTRTSHPGRMSPWTAIGFIGIGAAVMMSFSIHRRGKAAVAIVSVLTALVNALATAMLLMYVLEADPTLGAISGTRMAVHTAALFWMLSAGLGSTLAVRSAGAQRAFKAVPIVLGLVITVTVRQGLVDRDHALTDLTTQGWVDDVRDTTEQLVRTRVEALERMAARAASGAYATGSVWHDDARLYSAQVLDGHPIAWIDPDFTILQIEPTGWDTTTQMDGWLRDPVVAETAARTQRKGRPAASEPVDVTAERLGTIVLAPVIKDGRVQGWMAGAMDYTPLFDRAAGRDAYNIRIDHGDRTVYALLPDATSPTSASPRTVPLALAGTDLLATAWPTSGTVDARRSRLPIVVLLAGLAMTGLIAGLTGTAQARRRSESRFRALLESAPDAIVIVDRRGRMILINSRTEAIFGYPRQELLGKPISALSPERVRDRYTDSTDDWPMGRAVELTGLRRDGTEMPVEVTLSPIPTAEGLLVSAAIRDVTERHEMVERLRRSDQLKTEFVSTVSHEMRTPLTIIREFTSIVQDGTAGPISEEQADHLQTVVRNCDRLTGLIGDLLELARLESGKYRMDREQVAVEPLLRQCVEDFGPVCAAKQQTIELDVPDPVPDVMSDRERVIQVIVNLVGNAHKFTPEGGQITLRARANGAWIEIEVADSGIGIADEDLATIFGAFVQVGRRDGPGAKGTGLGLNVARQIVELHGGSMKVESRIGEGTRFSFTLPAYDAGLFEAFIAPHVKRRQLAQEVLSLVLVREKTQTPGAPALEAVYGEVASLRREGRDEALLDRSVGLLAVVLEADSEGARQFVRRLLAAIGDGQRGLDYAVIPISDEGIIVERVFRRDAAIGWSALT